MNAKLFFIMIAAVALFMFSCNGSTDEAPQEEAFETPQEEAVLYAVATEKEGDILPPNYINNPYYIPYVYNYEDLLFTGDDIKSFNITTGEIVFTDSIVEKLHSKYAKGLDTVTVYRSFSLYYGEKLLFKDIPFTSPVSSMMINDLVCVFGDIDAWEAIFLVDGYPIIRDEDWEDLPWHNKDEVRRTREENFKKREAEWNIFIRYLRDTDKIVE
jgi:hypothetical protein